MSDINIIDGFRPNYGNICVGEVKFFADMVNLIFDAEIFCGYVLGEGGSRFLRILIRSVCSPSSSIIVKKSVDSRTC